MDVQLFEPETREQNFNRLNKAIENLESGKNLLSFSEKEFDELSENLLNN